LRGDEAIAAFFNDLFTDAVTAAVVNSPPP
jgi:hypothetical protein